MANVLYYLGAGASANALPIVNEMTERFGLFFLMAHYYYDKYRDGGGGMSELIRSIGALYFVLKKNRSIDTYAKELWLKNKNDVSREERIETLKNILSLYLIWEERHKEDGFLRANDISKDKFSSYLLSQQDFVPIVRGNNCFESAQDNRQDLYPIKEEFRAIIEKFDNLIKEKKLIDDRYINFLIDVSEQGQTHPKFPSNKIKIVSWNYDNQFELACDKKWAGETYQKEIKPNLLQLNGKFERHKGCSFIGVLEYFLKNKKYIGINWFDKQQGGQEYSDIKFAWETEKPNFDEFLKPFDNYGAKHIVVIGYSFPFANREIDKLILQKIISNNFDTGQIPRKQYDNNTKKYSYHPKVNIYIQALSKKDYEDIKERIISLADIDLEADGIKITQVEDPIKFFIPNAL
ncbi:MAG: hypothetical protein QM529_04870 [Hydrotalea sp.]|nr:hypothetical protein [Hydrotalea sp.]